MIQKSKIKFIMVPTGKKQTPGSWKGHLTWAVPMAWWVTSSLRKRKIDHVFIVCHVPSRQLFWPFRPLMCVIFRLLGPSEYVPIRPSPELDQVLTQTCVHHNMQRIILGIRFVVRKCNCRIKCTTIQHNKVGGLCVSFSQPFSASCLHFKCVLC